MNAPEISVVIPLYNKAPYIKRTIDTVLSQTIQNFEIIVIGGNSTDGGEDIVLKYDDSRIKFIKERGKGVSEARNQGVEVARSELIAFLDVDDEWLPQHLETILNLQNKYPNAEFLSAGHQLITPHKTYPRPLAPKKGERCIYSYFEERVAAGIRNQFIITSAVAVHKSLFLKIGGFNSDFIVREDLDLFGRLAIYSVIAYTPNITVRYHNELPNNTRYLVRYLPPANWDYIDSLCEDVRRENSSKLAGCLIYAEMMYASIGFENAIRGYREESVAVWKKVTLTRYPIVRLVSYILNVLPDCIRKKIMDLWYEL